jgi:hypothetical protein
MILTFRIISTTSPKRQLFHGQSHLVGQISPETPNAEIVDSKSSGGDSSDQAREI